MGSQIVFIDIETVPVHFLESTQEWLHLFTKKFKRELDEMDTEEEIAQFIEQKSSLHAEFGKIVCISIGLLKDDKLRITSIASKNEKTILERAGEYLIKVSGWTHVAHNGMEFDYPFIRRRYMINGLSVPAQFETYGRKPWETKLEDTMDIWSGTQWKYRVSLELLAHCFGIPSPKGEMDGSKVAEVFYGMSEVATNELPFDKEENALKAIGDYCAGDVITLAKVYCKMRMLPELTDDKIERV